MRESYNIRGSNSTCKTMNCRYKSISYIYNAIILRDLFVFQLCECFLKQIFHLLKNYCVLTLFIGFTKLSFEFMF
ncbi:Uncharacterised protein [Bartonella vinsonii]|uniref:Uncharacterized protein n=1 Tax=Bartonella vinsonii TaxID=33047 RepID=A0A3S5ATU5_BARVI|nr:Uncharacterised protein [Bartonella vinsonii]